ncbi:MAG: Rid family detoxifying hydrolase [Synergistaceae bacterium]|jgi:2-iminobutanoate/2-iminopropanoate deaminase|nr:Rid family detoxifying hydrolase [Synergistaceae bacterium]
MKKTVSCGELPAAIGPYSHAAWAGEILYCSGQLGVDPGTGALVGTDIASQAKQALENISALLRSQGLSLSDVVKTMVFLSDIGDFKAFNEVYGGYFASAPPPRSCVAAAGLPLGALVEIEVIAHR